MRNKWMILKEMLHHRNCWNYIGIHDKLVLDPLREVSKCGDFSGPYFPAFGLRDTSYLSAFNPNVGKYGPEKLHIWTLSRSDQYKC